MSPLRSPLDLDPLIDHHCHGLRLDPLERADFESLLNEAGRPAPAGTTFFDSLLGSAVRRWCAPVLGLEPHADPDAYLRRRRELGADASRRLLTAAGIDTFVVDTGIGADRSCSPSELAELGGGTSREIVRLETVAEQLLAAGVDPHSVPERIEDTLRTTRAVGAKSIAAYRVGLDLAAEKPITDEVVAALAAVGPDRAGRLRIAHPVVHDWLAWTAIEHRLPLQLHVGLGDADLDLRLADPLRLTAFLRATEDREIPVLLLHNYPYHRQAAYLAQVFAHVHLDLGLTVHNTGARSRAVIAETLELVPFGKLLFATDAYGLAELYHLGALLFRRGLGEVLDDLVGSDDLTAADARRLRRLVGRDNARRVYGLDVASAPIDRP